MDRVHESMDRERRWSTVDHGHRPGEGSPENRRNSVPLRRTSPRLRKNGEGMEVSLTGCKRGRRRVGHDRAMVGNDRRRRRSVEWVLRTQKQAIEGEVSVVMAGGCSSSFYSGRGGARRGKGGTAGGNGLNVIEGAELLPEVAGCSGGAAELGRSRRKVMKSGAHLSAGHGEG